MNLLDLYEQRNPYQQNIDERQLQEGGVDNLEARRIDDLNMRMLELLDRAKEPAYKKNPAALAGLKKQFQKIKSERDSYFKINPATGMNDTGTLGTVKGALDELGIPGNVPTEKIPGKEDLLKGKGRSYYEGAEDYAGTYSPEAIALGKRFCEHYSITDDTDVQFTVEIIDSYLDEFKAAGEPVDLKRIKSGVADAFRQANRGLGIAGPNFRKKFQEAQQSPRALGGANFQRLVKANMGNLPTVSLEFIRPEENFKLDQKGLDLISDYYDGLESDQAKNYFIYRVLPSGDETLKVLKQLGWSPQQVQLPLPGVPTQGELPLQEKKKSDKDDLKAGDVKVARELQKLRARYPAVSSDIEAVASAEIDSTERSQQQLAAIRGANEKQDALLKQLVALDKEQGREIDGLDQENNSLEQRLAQVQNTNAKLQQAIGQMTGAKKATAKTQTTAPQGSTDIAKGGIIDVSAPAPDTTSATDTKPTTPSAMAATARQIAGFNQPAPELDATVSDKETDSDVIQRPAKLRVLRPTAATNADEFKLASESDITEHGGGIGPRQHWQDLMPEQFNTDDDDWYDDEDTETDLRSGDYVRDTMDGESGEIFRMQGDPYERRVRILDRDGKGWYIEPSRLTRVDSQDPDVQRYFGKKRVRDMDEAVDEKGALKAAQAAAKFIIRNLDDRAALKDYSMHFWSPEKFYQGATMAMRGAGHDEIVQQITQDRPAQFESGVEEGWSDAMVARRTGGPRTPYSVYIKGKKWKDFANDDLARAVMDKLKAKFKADGRDPETITIAPTDMTEAVKEPTTRQELLNRVDKIQRMMSQERNPANLQILRKELEMLKQRYQHLKEDNDSEAVERAILNRIMVAHTDLLMKFGPEKVMQAAEEVAYNVGDVDEIGTSDVSAYVAQVKQILGAVAETQVNEKWSAKYKSSINCADPKGFSQKAHCAGRNK